MVLVACGGASRPAAPLFPGSVGTWKLRQSSDLPAGAIPESIGRLGVRRSGSGEYEGAGTLRVEIYEMTSSAAALEAEQTWRPVADTVAFHRESYFTVVHWDGAARGSVPEFVREMQKLPD